ncbi:alpha-2-macroglobulin receptor-associated protein-like [Clavelina lepadiformis]|uniref:alpha-2-macroglobulin receptor-associated protein-like n=1 Tax=Clavelina lepadiformis TaxID=159417 RepID=UPI004042AC90
MGLQRCLPSFSIAFIVIIFTLYGAVDSLEKKRNDVGDGKRAFRSGRVHQLWEKAERLALPSVTMTDLYAELKQHDRELIELKAMKAKGGDEDGRLQAQLQQEFNNIMYKYGLAGRKNYEETRDLRNGKPIFEDAKLSQLWQVAMSNNKFTTKELDKLYLEFKHHEDKLVELNNLKKDIKRIQAISENSLERLDEGDVKEKESTMMDLHSEVEDSYKRLNVMSKKTKDDIYPFTEPRVLDLWEKVKEGNFSDEEVESLKEELRHFEVKMDKHRHFREELRNSAEKIEYHGGKKDAPTERLSKHQKLHDKVRDLADKVHKVYTGLKNRINSGVIKHGEL